MKTTSIVMGILLAANFATAQVKQLTGKSKISHVTLYRSQAMVSREVKVNNETGELAILIDNLPSSIDPGSLFATSDDMKIRSVRYLTEYITDKRQKGKISELEKKIEEIEVLKKKIQPERTLIASKKKFLEQLEAKYISQLGPSTTPLTDKEIKVSGFDFKTIEQMTEFIFKRQQEITTKALVLDDKARKLDNDIRDVKEQLNALFHDSPEAINQNVQTDQQVKVLRKAMVYAAKKNAKHAKLTLNYLVNNAGWNPTYNMGISENTDSLRIEYLAHVKQLTGEDWNGVTLKLSTATPNMNAEIPILAPMWTRLVPSGNRSSTSSANDNLIMKNWLSQNALNGRFQQKAQANYDDYNISVNKSAIGNQLLDFTNRKEILKQWYEGLRKMDQQIAVEYKIPDTITLASRKDNQMVQILSTSIPCNLYYEAVPLLANYVSRGIEAKNTLNQPLLAGKYSAFINEQYVGAGNLPLTVTGQTLSIGFGVDPQLKCRRELVDKIGDKSWGNRIETYTYAFTVENFKSNSVNIILLDRIPVTKDKGLKITLKKGEKELSKDKDYRKFDYPKGILRWEIKLPASSSGSNATTLNYSFDMKFDSDMQISTQGKQIQQELKKDLRKLKRRRFKK